MSPTTTSSTLRSPFALLTHPAVLASVAVVAVNDHVLKGSGWLPGAVTGKLSDVAGLFFFPILVAALLYIVARGVGRLLPGLAGRLQRRGLARDAPRLIADTAIIATVVGFAAVNVVGPVNALAEQYWGVFTMDATDLFCLPVVLIARRFMLARASRSRNLSPMGYEGSLRWSQWAALGFAVVVSVATSRPLTITTTSFPAWEVAEREVACRAGLEVRPWFAKSGEEGAGLVLRFDVVDGKQRTVGVERAQLHLSPRENAGDAAEFVVDAQPVASITVDDHASIYVPFLFDNEDAWNEGLRDATVIVELRVDDQPAELEYRARHREAPWGEEYLWYGFGSDEVDDRHQTWGPDSEDSSLERTGPHEEREGEYLRRNPDRPDELRVRLDYQWRGGCEGGDGD